MPEGPSRFKPKPPSDMKAECRTDHADDSDEELTIWPDVEERFKGVMTPSVDSASKCSEPQVPWDVRSEPSSIKATWR